MKEYLKRTNNKPKELLPAIENGMCNRCFSRDLVQDRFDRFFCPHCLLLESDHLYRYERNISKCDPKIREDLVLSPRQIEASDYLIEALTNQTNRNLLAVCGAGKTEMTYPVVYLALKKGMRVCYAIPRREVVRELAKRLRRDFGRVKIGEMHMEKKEDEDCAIVVSTINQLINYYREFDLIILDEVDAFPFSGNKYLTRLVEKAATRNAIFIRMSATMFFNDKQTPSFVVPERFHGFDLDVPQYVQTENMLAILEQSSLPSEFEDKINLWLRKEKRVFVFVPTIEYGRKLAKILENKHYPVAFLYAESPLRKKTLNDFYMQKIKVLVTTTVMERGVTYDDVQVAVMMADHPVYSSTCLVQISGRAGRYKNHPSGEIVFFAQTVTKEIISSRKEIIRMNRLKRKALT